MEQTHTYFLSGRSRMFHYPYRLCEIGWMPHHIIFHRHTVIRGCYICLSSKIETESEIIINGNIRKNPATETPLFTLILPGTVMESVSASYHDELYFRYPPECVEAVLDFLGVPGNGELSFSFSAFPEEIVAHIRRELSEIDRPGAPDRLDQLAIQLFTELLLRRTEPGNRVQSDRMKLHTIAAELLRGRKLSEMLRQYGLSERTFYREWRQLFSVSPAEYRIEHQLKTACRLLEESDLSPAEIASECGMSGTVYFYQLFRRKLATTPGEWRAAHHSKTFTATTGR